MAVTAPHAGVAIVPSKLQPPSGPLDELHRSRLDAPLDSGRQVVIVTAPAGYGKSTLVAGWLRRSPGRRAAWVSLDPFDRSPMSFWRHVTAALAELIPRLDEADAILLERGGPAPEFIAALIHGVLDDGGPIVLVLDDLHHVDPDIARDGLTTLVERCAGVLRLVALGRSDPPLPTPRWLADGRAMVVGSDALAFRPTEATTLLQRFDLAALGHDEIVRLNDHVEGWAVGLLLSGLTLDGRSDLAASLDDLLRSDRHLTDYLLTEVLARLPDELRDLALVLAVPPSFDEELARRLTGRDDAPALIDRLVRSNPFVVAIPSPPSHRFHHLLRSLLADTLRWADAAAFEQAHRTTAAVMAERGRVAEAVASLLEIGAVDEAFDLVTRPVLQTSDQGRVRELAQWLEMLGDVRPTDRVRALDFAMALLIAGRTSDAIAWVEQASLLAGSDDPATDVLHAIVRTTTFGAAGLVDAALQDVPTLDAAGEDSIESLRLDSRVSVQATRVALEVDDLGHAERWLPHVEQHPDVVVSHVHAPALRAWMLLTRGSIPEALSLATTACAAADRLDLGTHTATFDALLSLGRAELLSLRLDELRTTLERLGDLAETFDLPFFLLRLWPLQMAERALTDGWPTALELTATWNPGEYLERGGRLDTRHTELRSLALLNCGMLDEAASAIDRLPEGVRRSLLAARLLVVEGRAPDAAHALADHPDWYAPHRLEALLLLAQASTGLAARDAMTTALELGHTTGMVAPFVLEGRRIEQVLADLPVDQLCPALGAWQRARRAGHGRRRSADIIEPLTAKELAVLERLPSHATYRAIGAQLYVSVNTVKTHVSSVYRKLGVASRAEAVEVARRCGLLD